MYVAFVFLCMSKNMPVRFHSNPDLVEHDCNYHHPGSWDHKSWQNHKCATVELSPCLSSVGPQVELQQLNISMIYLNSLKILIH